MVASYSLGSLAARASFLLSSHSVPRAEDQATYTANTVTAIEALQTWYDEDEGLWDTTGWWNSANGLQVLADFSAIDVNDANSMNLGGVMANTFYEAQQTSQEATKTLMMGLGLVLYESKYTKSSKTDSNLTTRGYGGFQNNFYDDEGWWALAWIRSYDVTGVPGYLDMAEAIFQDMAGGVDSTCGGGMWWSKERVYKNAIANELYLAVAASLANRAADKQYYLDIANTQWEWFQNSGMINSDNIINDGLVVNSDGSCSNNGQQTWTYNQGVILGGLVELNAASGDETLLTTATTIASAAINALSKDGILKEGCEPNCGSDGAQFKGIFMRNLHYLQLAAPQDVFKEFIFTNADSIWNNNRDENNYFGIDWSGPANAGDGPNAGTSSSAIDTLVAAMAVS